MDNNISGHIENALHHLYINPLEKCNLRCKICYTKKTAPILTENEILDFTDAYRKCYELQTVTLCGGEVFTLPYINSCINTLVNKGIFVQIITNGTVDTLHKIHNPNSVNLIVSIDGLERYHDLNRGTGNFRKSVGYLEKARALGFHTEIFSIVTRQNYRAIDLFELEMDRRFPNIDITYHPRKPVSYLNIHPFTNIKGKTDNFEFLDLQQVIHVMKTKRVFPPKELGCYQISVASTGIIYGCCEGFEPIGTIKSPVKVLADNLYKRIQAWEKINTLHGCLGCSQADFMCGIKPVLEKLYD